MQVRGGSDGTYENWRVVVNTFRTLCLMPTPEVRLLFQEVRKLALAA